ncbi:MAG: LacI family DNA-binding transcriptional regulator [Chloroflexota bacterium]|nr:LacI family DNA-binding transcriptional regulator [Chloroflexota bacterium]
MPVTIKDIAEAANVSHTTVSRALKGRGRISQATAERIRELAQEMGYRPSAVAQSLVTQRTRTIGVVVTTIADPFVVNIVNGIENAAHEAGYSVFLSSSHKKPERELAVVETFYERRVDAVIVSASRVGNLYSQLPEQFQVPIVLINNQAEGEYIYTVASDDIQGAALGVRHLLDLGHRRIAFIGSAARPFSSIRRQHGYAQALAGAGLFTASELVVSPEAVSDVDAGRIGLMELLPARPSAILAYNDMTAVGIMQEAQRRQIPVPQQLSLLGFDDIELTDYLTPPLTSVNQPKEAMGQAAVAMALDMLAERPVNDRLLPCRLVVRHSTAVVSNG